MINTPFFDKPVPRLEFPDVRRFLEREVREGYRLDYKREPGNKLIHTACAFANSSGGYIVVGVSDTAGDMPDLDDLPGVDDRQLRSARDLILGNTRPPVRLEVQPVELPDKPGRYLLVIYVEESPAAPHEVTMGGTRIRVRRADTNADIGIDDIEGLMARRSLRPQPIEAALASRHAAAWFHLPSQPDEPILAAAMRPRRTPDLRFGWSEALDDTVERLALGRHVVEPTARLIPRPSGVVIGRPGEVDSRQRVELGDDGLITCARVLVPETIAGSPDTKAIALDDALATYSRMLRFAADVYRLVEYVDEMEVWLSLQGFYSTRLRLAGPDGGPVLAGPMPQSLATPQIVSHTEYVRLGKHGGLSIGNLTFLAITRWVSRCFGARLSEETLRGYAAAATAGPGVG
jgi:hypothetical protein